MPVEPNTEPNNTDLGPEKGTERRSENRSQQPQYHRSEIPIHKIIYNCVYKLQDLKTWTCDTEMFLLK